MSHVGLRTVLWPRPPSLLFRESLLLVCESTWKVLPLMSDVVPVLAASVWSSCKGFSFFRLLNIWRHWSITKGGERRWSSCFSWPFHQKQPFRSDLLQELLFYFILFYFENPRCATSLWCLQFVHVYSVFTVCISMFDTIENDMTCDAFNVSDVKSYK